MSDPTTLVLLAAIFLLAGTVKGAVGLGLPTTALALMTLTLAPRTAIALILVPMVLSNAWQVYRSGDGLGAFHRYLPFTLTLMLGVGITVHLAAEAPDRALYAMLGIAILTFVAVNATPWAPHVPDRLDRPAQIIAGSIAGIIGGITSVWAPPMALYLAARQTPKDEFVRASGLLIFFGSLPLAWGYIAQGYMTWTTTVTSTALLIPTIAGFALGERLRGHLSEKGFRTFLMVVFALMGLNLLRRAFV